MTIYCPETKQVLDKVTLGDKQGERFAVVGIVSKIGKDILPGIMSGDAGIVSPLVTSEIISGGHGYVLQIKGNSGMAFDEARSLPWDRVVISHIDRESGHGRTETRIYKSLEADFVEFDELDRYQNVSVVVQVERTTLDHPTGKISNETSYYIGDEVFASFDLKTKSRYVRDHWGQESYHWIKDFVLKEDASMQRTSNGSRALSTVRSLVVKIGRAVCGSSARFKSRFCSNPEKMVLCM